MNPADIRYKTYTEILREELIPAMGCTEPIALAYCAAKARDTLGAAPERVLVEVSGNIVKNVKSVVVPNTGGLKGIEAAAAVGLVAGRSELVLEVISQVSDAEREALGRFLKEVPMEVRPMEEGPLLDIRITLWAGEHSAMVRISDYHTNIVHIEKDGQTLYKLGREQVSTEKANTADKTLLNVKDILEYADTVRLEDVQEIIDRQVEYNWAISQEGLKNKWGANIGKVILASGGATVSNRARATAAAGSDARMSGCEMPVIINSGSGNQGICVSMPVVVYARELGVTKEHMTRALVLANLLGIHQKTGIGSLSAYCGAVSAGCAAACGIAYLYGGGYVEIAHTLVNSLAVASGIVCDGAKPSCAAKIALAVEGGLLGYQMFMNGQEFRRGEGIVSDSVEATIRNVGRLGANGMRETDREIIRIMTGCV